MIEADYVVVGSGSAGSALAWRLSEAGRSVVVIEHGGSDAGPFIQMPGALSYPMRMPRYDWGFATDPEPHMGGRRMACPRGKVIGGSSSINGMVWVRGHPQDYAHWQASGAEGWDWPDVLPYFRRIERWEDGGHGGDPAWRGDAGRMRITRGRLANPLMRAFVEAGVQAGYGRTADYNGARQEGFGPFDRTIWRGTRQSAARAYLYPALRRFNCRLVQGLARRVLFDGRRAIGVEIRRGGRIETVRARREVVLAASTINTPKLLMHSGIGPAAMLSEFGIAPLVDRPGVGGNLQDHLEVYVQFESRKPVSLYSWWGLAGRAGAGAAWLLARGGPGASNQFEAAGFVRSAAGVPYPDVQFHFLPLAVRYDGTVAARCHGFQVHTGPMRSPSRGRVALASPDPEAAPSIRFDYMSHPEDWRDFRRAIRAVREVVAQPAFDEFRGRELAPGADLRSDDALDDFVRREAESAYHPCGTARMGAPDDPMAVVDPEARVIGVEALRVADSSVFPRITNGNLNAPSILVGEKVADHLLGRSLPRDERPVWEPADWRGRDREAQPQRRLETVEAIGA